MKKIILGSAIFILIFSFSGIAFSWSGNCNDFAISSVKMDSFGNIEIWGRGPSHTYDVKLVVAYNHPRVKEMLAMSLTAHSMGSLVDAYIWADKVQSLNIK